AESWTGATGGVGKSLNTYDRASGRWQQTWVSDQGELTDYFGALSDGAMVFLADEVEKDGTRSRLRMGFFNLGQGGVRQLIERSTDGGETWRTLFAGHYTRRP